MTAPLTLAGAAPAPERTAEMDLGNLTTQQVNEYARLRAAEAALADGAPEVALMILARTVKVKARRGDGVWVFSDYTRAASGVSAVVFADLSGDRPAFYVAPAAELDRDVTSRYKQVFPNQEDRPRNPASRNCTVSLADIEKWGPDWRGAYVP